MMRRILFIFAILAAICAFGAYQFWLSHQPYEWSGTVQAHTVRIGSRIGGRVKQRLVEEGDQVEIGQAILVLEPGDLDAQRRAAHAQLQLAEAGLQKVRRGARKEQIEASESRLEALEIALAQANDRMRRAATLFEGGAASPSDKEDAEQAQRAALAQRDAAKHQYEELHNGAEAEDIQVARAQVEAAQARLDQIQVMLDELTVRAPVAGRIEALPVRPGDLLPPNATAATLLEKDQIYVRIYVPETQLGHIRVGQEVPIIVDSFPDRSFKGQVEHIQDVGEFSPRNLQTADERANQVFATRIQLVEGKDVLRAGMAAFIQVPR